MKKKRNLFMSISLMSAFITMTFQFDEKSIQWIWEDQILAAFILGVIAIIFGTLWYKEERKIKLKKM